MRRLEKLSFEDVRENFYFSSVNESDMLEKMRLENKTWKQFVVVILRKNENGILDEVLHPKICQLKARRASFRPSKQSSPHACRILCQRITKKNSFFLYKAIEI